MTSWSGHMRAGFLIPFFPYLRTYFLPNAHLVSKQSCSFGRDFRRTEDELACFILANLAKKKSSCWKQRSSFFLVFIPGLLFAFSLDFLLFLGQDVSKFRMTERCYLDRHSFVLCQARHSTRLYQRKSNS